MKPPLFNLPLFRVWYGCLALGSTAVIFAGPQGEPQTKGQSAFSLELSGVDRNVSASVEAGYYIFDNLELGLETSYGKEGAEVFAVGPYLEYYFTSFDEVGIPLSPFVGTSGDYFLSGGKTTLGYNGYVGLRYKLSSDIAIFGTYEYRDADEPIFTDSSGRKRSSNDRFAYGIQFLF